LIKPLGITASSIWFNPKQGAILAKWNSGKPPSPDGTVWIEIDLGALCNVSRLVLGVHMDPPNGLTTHKITYGPNPGPTQAIVVTGNTVNNTNLIVVFPAGSTAQYIRIATTASPSWVAWNSFDVFGPGPAANTKYFIRSKASTNKVLDILYARTDKETPAIVWELNRGLNQQFVFEANGFIRCVHSKMVLDVFLMNFTEGNRVNQYPVTNTNAQYWQVLNDQIAVRASPSFVLASLTPGDLPSIAGCVIQGNTYNNAQRWIFEEVTPVAAAPVISGPVVV